jgi:hypothetical protein
VNVLPPARSRVSVLAALALFACAGCVAHTHSVGLGATGSTVVVERQFYFLFGFTQINEVDPQRMAEGLTSYTIETEFGFVDLLLLPILLPFTATSRTVIVST